MFVYLFLVIFCFLLSFVKQTRTVEVLAFVVIASIICCGYMTGSDWRMYELFYNHKIIYDKEILYGLLNNFFSSIGVSFWFFFILLKIVLLFVFFFVYKRLGVPLLFCMMMFVVSPGLYLFVDNPMRNLIAYAIFAYSVKYIVSRDFAKYVFCTIIAFGFHHTALVMLPIYFLYNVNMRNRTLIILFILINVLFASQKIVLDIVEFLSSLLPSVGNRMIFYIEGFRNSNQFAGDFESKVFSLGLLVRIFGFVVLLFYKERIIDEFKYGRLVFLLSILYLLLFRIGLSFALFIRITLFFEIFYICAIGYILVLLSNRNKIVVNAVICLYLFLCTYKITTKDFRYIPYTNYISYTLKGKHPSYKERSKYNFEHSPYHTKGTEYSIEY